MYAHVRSSVVNLVLSLIKTVCSLQKNVEKDRLGVSSMVRRLNIVYPIQVLRPGSRRDWELHVTVGCVHGPVDTQSPLPEFLEVLVKGNMTRCFLCYSSRKRGAQ